MKKIIDNFIENPIDFILELAFYTIIFDLSLLIIIYLFM